ncbi:hypothetical protein P7C70_g3368, partial [Phenoliferia sp. Uapishka_3]
MGRGGGKGGGNSRQRDMDDDKGGPTKVQLKGLAWNKDAAQPAFLRNALSALQGPKKAVEWDGTGRPPIPERPEGEEEEERQAEDSEEDEWDMGRGEEAPAVVVLKEGRHLDRDEVDRMRAEAKASASADPLASSSAPAPKGKQAASLTFSSTSGVKRKVTDNDTAGEWDSVVKRSKVDGEAKKVADEQSKVNAAKDKAKEAKRKVKEKKEAKKKVGMLSFGDDE